MLPSSLRLIRSSVNFSIDMRTFSPFSPGTCSCRLTRYRSSSADRCNPAHKVNSVNALIAFTGGRVHGNGTGARIPWLLPWRRTLFELGYQVSATIS